MPRSGDSVNDANQTCVRIPGALFSFHLELFDLVITKGTMLRFVFSFSMHL